MLFSVAINLKICTLFAPWSLGILLLRQPYSLFENLKTAGSVGCVAAGRPSPEVESAEGRGWQPRGNAGTRFTTSSGLNGLRCLSSGRFGNSSLNQFEYPIKFQNVLRGAVMIHAGLQGNTRVCLGFVEGLSTALLCSHLCYYRSRVKGVHQRSIAWYLNTMLGALLRSGLRKGNGAGNVNCGQLRWLNIHEYQVETKLRCTVCLENLQLS